MTWEPVKLADAATLLIGFAFKSSAFLNADDEGVKILRGDNVQQGYIRWGDKTKKWTHNEYADLERYQLEEGDVILAMDRPIVGDGLKFAWITKEDLPALLVQRVCCLRGRQHVTLTSFLRYVIADPKFSDHIHKITTGANIPHISGKDIAAYEFLLPETDEQEAIVNVLSSYDDLIAANQRRIQLLEESARLLYREWFVKLRFPGHEIVPVTDGVPEDWARKPVSDMVDIKPKTPFPKDVVRPFVGMEALSTDSMIVDVSESRPIAGGAKFRNGDTLLARITPCLENGKTGFVQFLEDETAAASGSTEFIVLRSCTVNPYWVYCLARSESFREHAIRSMAGSDGRQRVNAKSFDQYFTLQPPQHVLQQFEDSVSEMFAQLQSLTEYNRSLQEARDLLLPKLMSGALDVSRISIPEEATV